ncbi:STAS domain-containing protein [Maricaulis sp. CAU 1757]
MQWTSKNLEDVLRIELSGMLTFDDHERFRGVLDAVRDTPCATIRMDLSGVSGIDSAGIGMLLLAQDRAGKSHRHLTLTGVRGAVREIVDLSQIDQIIDVE